MSDFFSDYFRPIKKRKKVATKLEGVGLSDFFCGFPKGLPVFYDGQCSVAVCGGPGQRQNQLYRQQVTTNNFIIFFLSIYTDNNFLFGIPNKLKFDLKKDLSPKIYCVTPSLHCVLMAYLNVAKPVKERQIKLLMFQLDFLK